MLHFVVASKIGVKKKAGTIKSKKRTELPAETRPIKVGNLDFMALNRITLGFLIKFAMSALVTRIYWRLSVFGGTWGPHSQLRSGIGQKWEMEYFNLDSMGVRNVKVKAFDYSRDN